MEMFDRKKFDRDFERMDRTFTIMFRVILGLIVCVWIGTGFAIYTVLANPEGVGAFFGRILHGAAQAAR
jgi:hypothetical protein